MGFKILPIIVITFVCNNSSVATKKGNNVGTTNFAQSVNPVLAADKLALENKSKVSINIIKVIENIFFLKLKIICLNFIKPPT